MRTHELKGERLFPTLSNFMGSWFHQDFDIEVETLKELITAFKMDSNEGLVNQLVADIEGFLNTGDAGM